MTVCITWCAIGILTPARGAVKHTVMFTWLQPKPRPVKILYNTVRCLGEPTLYVKQSKAPTQTLAMALPSGTYYCIATVTTPNGESGGSNVIQVVVP